MRLIDAENFCKEHQDMPSVVYVALSKSPTIDPIHAAGGCYCRECKYYSRKPDDSHGQMESFCKKLKRDPTYIRFCGYGMRKDGQNG